MGLLLTAAERERFAAWLDQEIASGEGIVSQLEKLPGPAVDVLARRERSEIVAAKVIAAKLRSLEDQVVG